MRSWASGACTSWLAGFGSHSDYLHLKGFWLAGSTVTLIGGAFSDPDLVGFSWTLIELICSYCHWLDLQRDPSPRGPWIPKPSLTQRPSVTIKEQYAGAAFSTHYYWPRMDESTLTVLFGLFPLVILYNTVLLFLLCISLRQQTFSRYLVLIGSPGAEPGSTDLSRMSRKKKKEKQG